MGKKDFFLSPDDAQTLGDIDYMRKAKRVRKTFPKTLKNKDGFELVTETSSMENRNSMTDQDKSKNTVFNPTPSSQSQPGATGGSAVTQTNNGFQSQSSITTGSAVNQANTKSSFTNANSNKKPEERRQQDNSMDMFRNMARNIKRGR